MSYTIAHHHIELDRDVISLLQQFLALREFALTARLNRAWYTQAHKSRSRRERIAVRTIARLIDLAATSSTSVVATTAQASSSSVSLICSHISHLEIGPPEARLDKIRIDAEANKAIARIATRLPHLVSLNLQLQIKLAVEDLSLDGEPNQMLPIISFSAFKQLRSLHLNMLFAHPSNTASSWRYVGQVFRLIAQTVAHSLIVLEFFVDMEYDGNGPVEEFDGMVLAPLVEMRELRVLRLGSDRERTGLSDASIDCIRAIPNLMEFGSNIEWFEEMLPHLLRAPVQRFTRLDYFSALDQFGRGFYPSSSSSEDQLVIQQLGSSLRTLFIIARHEEDFLCLKQCTSLECFAIDFDTQINVEVIVDVFSKWVRLEVLSMVVKLPERDSQYGALLSHALHRILMCMPHIRHIKLTGSGFTDLSFLSSVPHLAQTVETLRLSDIVLGVYTPIYSLHALTELSLVMCQFDIDAQDQTAARGTPPFETSYQLQEMFTLPGRYRRGEHPLRQHYQQLLAAQLPNLREFSQSVRLKLIDRTSEDERIIQEVTMAEKR